MSLLYLLNNSTVVHGNIPSDIFHQSLQWYSTVVHSIDNVEHMGFPETHQKKTKENRRKDVKPTKQSGKWKPGDVTQKSGKITCHRKV